MVNHKSLKAFRTIWMALVLLFMGTALITFGFSLITNSFALRRIRRLKLTDVNG